MYVCGWRLWLTCSFQWTVAAGGPSPLRQLSLAVLGQLPHREEESGFYGLAVSTVWAYGERKHFDKGRCRRIIHDDIGARLSSYPPTPHLVSQIRSALLGLVGNEENSLRRGKGVSHTTNVY